MISDMVDFFAKRIKYNNSSYFTTIDTVCARADCHIIKNSPAEGENKGRPRREPRQGRSDPVRISPVGYLVSASSSSTSSPKSFSASFTGAGVLISTPAIFSREMGSVLQPPERNFL